MAMTRKQKGLTRNIGLSMFAVYLAYLTTLRGETLVFSVLGLLSLTLVFVSTE